MMTICIRAANSRELLIIPSGMRQVMACLGDEAKDELEAELRIALVLCMRLAFGWGSETVCG